VDRLPKPVLALAGQVALIGTPEDAIARFRAMATAGVQYVVVAVAGDDVETTTLLVERVMPVLAGETALQP
jgi:alkanesulfonate monooxygenase SsuD/methylene tetrahydromethanopterin reductase-like flavin-dependent oxidoreductase (luciferase family)